MKTDSYVKSGTPPTTSVPTNGGVWQCPSAEQGNPTLGERARSYAISMSMTYDNGFGPLYYVFPNLAEMDKPAQTIYLGDGGSGGRLGRPNADWQGYTERYVTSSAAYTGGKYYTRDAPFRHMEGANYLFADGHAKWMKASVVYPHPAPPKPASGGALGLAQCAQATYWARNAAERDAATARAKANGVNCTP